LSTQSQPQGNRELSIYRDKLVKEQDIKPELKKLCAAFPEISDDFIILLSDRIIDNDFTVKRLQDAMKYLIDNFHYKKPNIADIISFDKRIKLYDYYQIIEMVNQYGVSIWETYKPIKTAHKLRLFASMKDIETYKLEIIN
jgi:hypothetical protein